MLDLIYPRILGNQKYFYSLSKVFSVPNITFSIQSTFTDDIVCFNLTPLVTGVLVGKNLKDVFYFWVLHLHCVKSNSCSRSHQRAIGGCRAVDSLSVATALQSVTPTNSDPMR